MNSASSSAFRSRIAAIASNFRSPLRPKYTQLLLLDSIVRFDFKLETIIVFSQSVCHFGTSQNNIQNDTVWSCAALDFSTKESSGRPTEAINVISVHFFKSSSEDFFRIFRKFRFAFEFKNVSIILDSTKTTHIPVIQTLGQIRIFVQP